MQVFLAIVLVLVILLVALAFPIYLIVHCARRSERSGIYRAIWIIIMILTFPTGSFVYGIFSSGKLKLRILSLVPILLSIVAIFAASMGLFKLKNKIADQVPQIVNAVRKAPMEYIEDHKKAEVMNAVYQIQKEMKGGLGSMKSADKNVQLLFAMAMIMQDQVMTNQEADIWLQYYRKRAQLSGANLAQLGKQLGTPSLDVLPKTQSAVPGKVIPTTGEVSKTSSSTAPQAQKISSVFELKEVKQPNTSRIVLKNGNSLDGVILLQDDQGITLRITDETFQGYAEVVFRHDEIESVEEIK